jgi:hypothetical protein
MMFVAGIAGPAAGPALARTSRFLARVMTQSLDEGLREASNTRVKACSSPRW